MKRLIQCLLAVAFLTLLSPSSFAVAVNDGVASTASPSLNVRQTPSTTSSILYTVPPGTIGFVLNGPTVANGYTWWYISWATNPTNPGWSVQDYLSVQPSNSTVYTDYLWPGWHHNPWSNTSVIYNSSTSRSGSAGIQVNASAAYARLYIQTTAGFTTANQQSLHLSLMNGGGSGQNLYVGLYNTSGTVIHYLPAWNYVNGGNLTAGTWYDLIIPIADLWAANQGIGGVVVEIESAGTFYADEISFSTVYGSTYWNPPPASTITSVTVSCSPTSVQTGGTSQCTANVQGTGNFSSTVIWSTNAGTINSSGLYIAPGTVPNPSTVMITATSVQDTSKSGSVSVGITAPSPPFSQASDVVFGDAVRAGWSLGSWNQVTIDPVSDTAFRGENGMQLQIATPNYGRLQLWTWQNYRFSTSGYAFLSFALNIGRYEGESLYVGLLNADGSVIRYVQLAPYTATHTLDAYQWQPVNIPLSDLSATNMNVYGIEIQSITPSTIFIDEMKFTGGTCSVQ